MTGAAAWFWQHNLLHLLLKSAVSLPSQQGICASAQNKGLLNNTQVSQTAVVAVSSTSLSMAASGSQTTSSMTSAIFLALAVLRAARVLPLLFLFFFLVVASSICSSPSLSVWASSRSCPWTIPFSSQVVLLTAVFSQ
eukprot:jgi/Botrbrau1/281/Bobra.0022s0249.1